jgi:hypothetical protein
LPLQITLESTMNNDRVFIVGLPRTGSTLLRTILNKSERVSICAETHFLSRWSRIGRKRQISRFGDLKVDGNVDAFLDAIFSSHYASTKDFWGWLYHNVDRQEFKNRLLQTDRSDRAIFDLFMQFYAEKRKGPIQSDWILGEKTSANIYFVPTLFEWYPNTKIIHTFRDPRGIFVSAAKLVRNGKWGVRSRLPSLPVKLLNPIMDSIMASYVTRTWLDAVRLHALYERQYPGKYLLVRFEDLIQDPERQIRSVCSFMDVAFDLTMVGEVAIVGSSYTAQRIVPGGFDQSAGDRWKEHINPLAGAWFSMLGKKHLKRFGYLTDGY